MKPGLIVQQEFAREPGLLGPLRITQESIEGFEAPVPFTLRHRELFCATVNEVVVGALVVIVWSQRRLGELSKSAARIAFREAAAPCLITSGGSCDMSPLGVALALGSR